MSFQQQIQQAVQTNQPKGDIVAALSTVGAIVNAVAEVAAPIFTMVAAMLGLAWWVLRIRQTRLETRQALEKHERDMNNGRGD